MNLHYTTHASAANPSQCQDRHNVIELPDRLVVVVADGAGNSGLGREAALTCCQIVRDEANSGLPTHDWIACLREVDAVLAVDGPGRAAAVVVEIREDGRVIGAGAGDCQARAVSYPHLEPRPRLKWDLTADQAPKPLLGDGAVPTAFAEQIPGSLLLVATDGLWKYLRESIIFDRLLRPPLDRVGTALEERLRAQSRELQDDVTIVTVAIPASS